MTERLKSVGEEAVPWRQSIGRVLTQGITADRPSPPCDVSAMDGYALRLGDAKRGRIEVAGVAVPGFPPPTLPEGKAVRIMTGGPVPAAAELVIKREDVREFEHHIELATDLPATAGHHIRRVGENLPAGEEVIPAGALVTPSIAAAIATFGLSTVRVYKPVRVAVMTTGDELLDVHEAAQPWQIRDSNGPALAALLAGCPWVQVTNQTRVKDDYAALLAAVNEELPTCDALLLTGGVSMGTHDFVPHVLREAGCEVIFHRLPQRPGGPILGAIGPAGQAVLGLPGNPLSVMTTARRIGLPVLRRVAGIARPDAPQPGVTLSNPDGKSLNIWWYRQVRLTGAGTAEVVVCKGSGDVVAAARADGFVEVPPGDATAGPFAFYRWSAEV
jgi:molybdopterin molybdotransferase